MAERRKPLSVQQELIGLFRLLRPGKAKVLGGELEIKGWLDRKFTIMYDLVRAKFEQNPDLAKKLLDTGDEEIGKDGTRKEVVQKYRIWIQTQPELLAQIETLRGKILGCWCCPLECHGEVLLEILYPPVTLENFWD